MIFLDLDGTLVDFCKAAYATHGRQCSRDCEPTEFDFFEQWGITADQFWAPIDSEGAAWWRNLEPYPWFDELCGLARRYSEAKLWIATASATSGWSAAGKVEAMQVLFGRKFRDYFITPRKWLLGAPGRILIDDKEQNCDGFMEHGGEFILIPQPWNRNRGLVGDRMGYVKERLEAICNAGV